MRNLSPLFSKDEKGFIGNLNLTENQKNTIQEAKKKLESTCVRVLQGRLKRKRG